MIYISLSSRDAAKTWMQACICISGNLSAASLARLRAELNPGVELIAAPPSASSQHPHCRSQEIKMRGFSLQHGTLTMMKKALFVMMKNAETCGLSREIKEKAAIAFILSKPSIQVLMFL